MSEIETPVNEDPQGGDTLSEWEGGAAEIEAGDRLVVDVEGFARR